MLLIYLSYLYSNQGTGRYVYIETSSPRQPGDTARLSSPWMRGPQCMMFYYHMYGASMGCVVIYIKSQAPNRLKPVWLRSQDQGNHWISGRISINETLSYQVSYNFCLQHLIYKKQKYNGTCHALSPMPPNIQNIRCYCKSQV